MTASKRRGMVHVRRAAPDDVLGLMELWSSCASSERQVASHIDEVILVHHLRKTIEDNSGHLVVFVADLDGDLRGILVGQLEVLYFSNDRIARCLLWWVPSVYRHGPAALKLWLAFHRWASGIGTNSIAVAVTTGHGVERTDRLLKKCGARLLGGNYSITVGGTVAK